MQLGVMNSKELQPLFDFTQKTYNDRTRTRTAEFQEAARDLDAALPQAVRALDFQKAQHAHVMHMT
ncbi:hypothetical protein J2W32_004655 [Variovorax boronicumulans]|uniref:Uncharacterized protein n=1 Tax=Variovorax boronicumulans TaxID=436515 RepID=A0AAW8D3P9_9BURK|nr:hypothetical protein [Variovorax boronicumulans]MDP9895697.1 hypothetical protein [Variovorax boronicumulans]MDQ0055595.1 hypothetical protein [Variovorax boronicumulans]